MPALLKKKRFWIGILLVIVVVVGFMSLQAAGKAKKAELGTVESLHNRRQVLKQIRDKSVVHTLFTEIAPVMAERPGGYTRILRVGTRRGDGVTMALIELV